MTININLKINGTDSNDLLRCLTLFEHFCNELKIYNPNSETSITNSILTQICNKLSDFIDDYDIKPDEILTFPDTVDETIQATTMLRELLLETDKSQKTTQALNELKEEFDINEPIQIAQYNHATVVKLPIPDQYIILKGSKISTKTHKSCPPKAASFRAEICDLIDNTGHLKENFKVYGKVSCVASIIVGYSVNVKMILKFEKY